jgi:hypothetical protein
VPQLADNRKKEEKLCSPFSLQMQRVTPPSSPPSSSPSSSTASVGSPCRIDLGLVKLALLARRPTDLARPPTVFVLLGGARLALVVLGLGFDEDESESGLWFCCWLRVVSFGGGSSISTSDSMAEPKTAGRDEVAEVGVGGWRERDERRRGPATTFEYPMRTRKSETAYPCLMQVFP